MVKYCMYHLVPLIIKCLSSKLSVGVVRKNCEYTFCFMLFLFFYYVNRKKRGNFLFVCGMGYPFVYVLLLLVNE